MTTRIENPRINDWGCDGGLVRITVYRTVMDATVPTEWTDRVAAVVRCRDGEYRAIEPIDSAVLADAVIRAAEQNDHIAACRAIADAVTDPRDAFLAGVLRGQQYQPKDRPIPAAMLGKIDIYGRPVAA